MLDAATSLDRVLERSAGRRVLVVGDGLVDRYTRCVRPTTFDEGAEHVLRPTRTDSYAGGAAVFTAHLAAAGLEPTLLTRTGPGVECGWACGALRDAGVAVEAVPGAGLPDWPVKERLLLSGRRVVKLDRAATLPATGSARAGLLRRAREVASGGGFDAALVVDFGLGLLDAGAARPLVAVLHEHVPLVCGDVSGQHRTLRAMAEAGADWLAPSAPELVQSAGGAGCWLKAAAGLAAAGAGVLVTRAGSGLTLVSPAAPPIALPAFNTDPVDTVGCGDALLSYFVMGLLGGATPADAAGVGSLAAACVASRWGNAAVSPAELRAYAAGRRSGCGQKA